MCMCANQEVNTMMKACLSAFTRGGGAYADPQRHARVHAGSLATAQHLCGALVGLVDPGLVGVGLQGATEGRGSDIATDCRVLWDVVQCIMGCDPYLVHDAVYLAVLRVDLVAHVQGHVTQVPDDAAHLLQVLVHLVLPGILRYPGNTSSERGLREGV